MSRCLHVIPVDPSLTADEAWHELCLMGVRATDTGEPTWATVECDGDECWNIATVSDSAPSRDATREPSKTVYFGRQLQENGDTSPLGPTEGAR